MFRISGRLFVIAVIIMTFSLTAFSGELRTLELYSKNIACSSCALHIKKIVGRMEGVKEIKVSSVNRKIHVQYDSSMISEDLIIRKINDLGFEVKREVN
jgi:copper chaperone CopZ